jgi:predicted MFS family arabinose efflux permease
MSETGRPTRSKAWRWGICLLLLAATTINYLDRMALATTAFRVKDEFGLRNEQYGALESGFSWAFAVGSLVFGILADRMSLRILYPFILLCWSISGFMTGFTSTYSQLIVCRVLLGFYEAGHWPCALKTVQRLVEPNDRPMANGMLQSGASVGAILTPFIVQPFLSHDLGWRPPFMAIGGIGAIWCVFWIFSIRSEDLQGRAEPAAASSDGFLSAILNRRFLALVVMLSLINSAFQIPRAWLPLFLREGRGYGEATANYFTSPYYLAAGLGTLAAGALALQLTRRGVPVHAARIRVFAGMALLTASTTAVALLPQGLPLLAMLLVVGFGALGVFPSYYSFAQELSERHVGKVNGLLSVCGWIATAGSQWVFGRAVDARKSFDLPLGIVGWAPLVALLLFVLLWTRDPVERRTP